MIIKGLFKKAIKKIVHQELRPAWAVTKFDPARPGLCPTRVSLAAGFKILGFRVRLQSEEFGLCGISRLAGVRDRALGFEVEGCRLRFLFSG